MALRRATRLPIMTGENMELAEWAIPFLQNQAVDIFQPDIINSGGITGVKMIADLAAQLPDPDRAAQRERFDVEHGVAAVGGGGVQLPADRVRGRRGPYPMGRSKNPIVIQNGHMKVSTEPGLGVELRSGVPEGE